MTNRITKTMLRNRIAILNDMFNQPNDPYAEERDAHGRLTANAGTYVLDCAYGGYRLGQMCKGGGERDITPRGTARETYDAINAFIAGVEAARAAQ